MKPSLAAATAAVTLVTALGATPALAFRPDIGATPFECSGYDSAAGTCTSTSFAEMVSDTAGTATSRILYSFNPLMVGAEGSSRAAFLITVRGPISIDANDIFCASGDVTVTVEAQDPETPAAFAAAVKSFMLSTMRGGGACYRYESIGGNQVHVIEVRSDGTDRGSPPLSLHLFSREDGAALTLAEQAI